MIKINYFQMSEIVSKIKKDYNGILSEENLEERRNKQKKRDIEISKHKNNNF